VVPGYRGLQQGAVALGSRRWQPGRHWAKPFRAHILGERKSSVGEYKGALADFRRSETLFAEVAKTDAVAVYRRIDALANETLALYALDLRVEAARIARMVVAKRPGQTDMRALLAADQWDWGGRELADVQWFNACNNIASGCRKYTDADWLRTVRRGPPALVDAQMRFLARVPPPPQG